MRDYAAANDPVPEPEPTPTPSPKATRQTPWWLWVATGLAICCCLILACVVGVFAYFSREPENLSVDYSMPSVVEIGESFNLVLTLRNTGNEPFMVSDIYLDQSLGGSFLDGSVVLETDPFMERNYSTQGLKIFAYNQTIQPGETKTITFFLEATKAGEFGGSIAVYVGDISKQLDYIGLIVQE